MAVQLIQVPSCSLPFLFLNSFFSDLDVFIKGALVLVNKIKAMMRFLSIGLYIVYSKAAAAGWFLLASVISQEARQL